MNSNATDYIFFLRNLDNKFQYLNSASFRILVQWSVVTVQRSQAVQKRGQRQAYTSVQEGEKNSRKCKARAAAGVPWQRGKKLHCMCIAVRQSSQHDSLLTSSSPRDGANCKAALAMKQTGHYSVLQWTHHTYATC